MASTSDKVERCCWKFWCCACNDSCSTLTDGENNSIRRPLLQDNVDATGMVASQAYFRSVNKAFQKYFSDDPEMERVSFCLYDNIIWYMFVDIM
jgi:hypothetical protein